MPALDRSLLARHAHRSLNKRADNWASENPGVIVVFAIIGAIAILLLVLFVQRRLQARRAARGA